MGWGKDGSTEGSQTWIVHTGGKKTTMNVKAELFFATATVAGKTGSLTIQLTLQATQGERNYGKWVIKDSSGEVEGLHGRGVWEIEQGVINRYEGTIHFKP